MKSTIVYALALLTPATGLQIIHRVSAAALYSHRAGSRRGTCSFIGTKTVPRELAVNMHRSKTLVRGSTVDDNVTTTNSNSAFGSLRSLLRKTTGFSLTATRAACRAATGISISSIFAKVIFYFGHVMLHQWIYHV